MEQLSYTEQRILNIVVDFDVCNELFNEAKTLHNTTIIPYNDWLRHMIPFLLKNTPKAGILKSFDIAYRKFMTELIPIDTTLNKIIQA